MMAVIVPLKMLELVFDMRKRGTQGFAVFGMTALAFRSPMTKFS
jgi:hypothetical protein